jgi:RNA polymerase subunit RPABC4/transcription elongation factor Spt4
MLMSIPVFLLMFVCIFAVPVLIAVYVYKDAKIHNMDAVLWTIVAVLVPGFIGLIVYLIVRSNNTNASCPKCHRAISGGYTHCPYCGAPLKSFCPTCNSPVENGWKACPKCGSPLPEEQGYTDVKPVQANRDKTLIWIIVAIVGVPLLLFIISIILFGTFRFQMGPHINVMRPF